MTTPALRPKEVLLPLAAGLMLVAVPHLLPRALVATLSLGTLLALGAALPGRPWQTGALATLPRVAAAVFGSGARSVGSLALTLLLAPLAAACAGLVVKGGSLLVHRPGADPDGPGTEGPDGDGRRWKPLETRAQRGRVLVIVAGIVLIGGVLLSDWGAAEADQAATRRAREVRAALEGRTPDSIRVEGLTGLYDVTADVPGGPYDATAFGSDHFDATTEVHRHLQYRCIHVHLGVDGHASTRIEKGHCGT